MNPVLEAALNILAPLATSEILKVVERAPDLIAKAIKGQAWTERELVDFQKEAHRARRKGKK